MEIKMIKRDKNSGDLLEIFGIDKEGHNDVAPNRNDNEIEDIGKGGYKGLVTCSEYIFWCNVDIVFDHVFHFLKDTFPKHLITSEFNNIDIFVFGERLPVEIQSTIYHYSEQIPRMSGFEQAVEKQIRENIETYGKCWLFFDSEFYRYLRNHTKKDSSVQLDWLYRYMKSDQLKVFMVSHKGDIKELYRKDFDFISDISVTCEIGKDNDFRILSKNKDIIFENVLKCNRFTTDYIYNIRKVWKKVMHEKEDDSNFKLWCTKQEDERINLLGRLMLNINNLNDINDVFGGSIVMNRGQNAATSLGIFESEGNRTRNRIKFNDMPNVAQYFPKYMRNKEKWDRHKGKWLTTKQLEGIIEGKVDYFWYEKEFLNSKITDNKDNKVEGGC